MTSGLPLATRFLLREADGLLTRIARLKPFALNLPMVVAANISPEAQTAIEHLLSRGQAHLKALVRGYRRWLLSPAGQSVSAPVQQRLFSIIRLRFNAIISQFDIFQDVLSQRSEHETGVWVSGLDDVAADSLSLPGKYFQAPPVVCYLDQGHGAAIRRAMTRLPGGDANPVAVIRIPRERMIGSGIASSLVHEAGHQGAVLLDLVTSLKLAIRGRQAQPVEDAQLWQVWERWASEMIADLWSVARIGIAATTGLMGVVSLPRVFIFRFDWEDPHPVSYLRVKLSCAMGAALYPDPQWERLAGLWEQLYPLAGLPAENQRLLHWIEQGIPELVAFLLSHRPERLRGRTIAGALASPLLQPWRLRRIFRGWQRSPARMRLARPVLVFAVLGQARADGLLSPARESFWLAEMLRWWALRSSLQTTERCALTGHSLDPAVEISQGGTIDDIRSRNYRIA